VNIILSRKGFDSGYGGWASPILPDGRMLSLPISASNGLVSYEDLSAGDGVSYLEIMHQLRHGHEGRLVLSHKTWLPSSLAVGGFWPEGLVTACAKMMTLQAGCPPVSVLPGGGFASVSVTICH
jgi:hypothetical protein